MTPGPGHNNGPDLSGDVSWRRFAWGRARENLLPTLPIEVLRLRVKRAADLGLPYKTYAGVRAASGRDVIGFLFSSNALRILRQNDTLPRDRQARLATLIGCDRTGILQPPLIRLDDNCIDAFFPAPPATATWSDMRNQIATIIRSRQKPADGYLVIGETALEREWAEAGRTAGFLTGDRYFTAPAP